MFGCDRHTTNRRTIHIKKMGEIIITQFGINEKVMWQRSEKNIDKKSEHIVKEIKTTTRYIMKQHPISSFFMKAKIFYYNTLAMFTPQSKILVKPYGRKAMQLRKDLELGQNLKKHRVVTWTQYYMMDVSSPIHEHELYAIPITEEKKEETITNK